ncbi:hypothetical protein IW146_007789, partial [Coemansia sp. RSA 922]
QYCTYAQERYLYKLQKLRQVTLDDLWPLPERFQLHTAYSEFKLNTNESYFVLRAIFRMMWHLSNYSMYMIVADVARIMIVQLLDDQYCLVRRYIKNEMARANNAIDIEMFRLPLQSRD